MIVTTATPNRITDKKLQRAHAQFQGMFGALPSPRVAVLIGGNSKTHKMTEESIDQLIKQLKSLDAGLMITVSRRTPDHFRKKLESALQGDHIYFWNGKGDNPYLGFLAHADYILATNDSASMLSEAATTGKPVYSIPLKGGSDKFTALYDILKNRGALREFDGKLEHWEYEPPQDAQKVAEAIKMRMKSRLKADKAS